MNKHDLIQKVKALDGISIDAVVFYLENSCGITVKNHQLGVWLSGKRENIDGIEPFEYVLLFKQGKMC